MNDTRLELEQKGLLIDPVHRQREPELLATRWFDYAHMHPVEATYAYAQAYVEGTRRFYERMVDVTTADQARAFVPRDIFKSRDLTSMWLARCTADTYGVPYDFVMFFAIERALNRLYRTMPRPNQLHGEEFDLDLRDAWQAECRRSLRYSRIVKMTGQRDALQTRHGLFVVEQIRSRQKPHVGLIGRMLHVQAIDEGFAREHFTDAEVDAALGVARSLG